MDSNHCKEVFLEMEVRRNSHGEGKLETFTCISDDNGFAVASVIVLGKEEAVLLDNPKWTLSNAHRVVAEILEAGRKLTKVFISHAHPDTLFWNGSLSGCISGRENICSSGGYRNDKQRVIRQTGALADCYRKEQLPSQALESYSI